MTKAAKILALYAQGKSTRDNAAAVGCDPAYVRVVARQRKGTGRSDIDMRYLTSPLGQDTSRAHARRVAQKQSAYYKTLYHALDPDLRAAVRAQAYREARASGADTSRAKSIATHAIMREALNSPRRRAAARAARKAAPVAEAAP